MLTPSLWLTHTVFAATFSDATWISMGGIPGAGGHVNAAVVDGAGNLYIGDDFTIVGDDFANHVAKRDGSEWSALCSGINDWVQALMVLGSDLYAGGYFRKPRQWVRALHAKIRWNSAVIEQETKWGGWLMVDD